MAVRYALPHGCFILLTLCPHPPMLIDLLASLLPSKARPIRSKGCELFNLSKSRQPIRVVVYKTNDHCRPPPDLIRSEQLGHLAQPLCGSTDWWRVAWFLFPVGNPDGLQSKQTLQYGCRIVGSEGVGPSVTPKGLAAPIADALSQVGCLCNLDLLIVSGLATCGSSTLLDGLSCCLSSSSESGLGIGCFSSLLGDVRLLGSLGCFQCL